MFTLTVFSIGHMKCDKKGWTGDKDQLESPESGVGDWKVVVIADIVTTWLSGVAIKVLLFVTPHLLAGHQEDQESEDENDGKPDATKRRRVLIHPAKEALKEGPVHGVVSDVRLDYPDEKQDLKCGPNVAGTLLAECSNECKDMNCTEHVKHRGSLM